MNYFCEKMILCSCKMNKLALQNWTLEYIRFLKPTLKINQFSWYKSLSCIVIVPKLPDAPEVMDLHWSQILTMPDSMHAKHTWDVHSTSKTSYPKPWPFYFHPDPWYFCLWTWKKAAQGALCGKDETNSWENNVVGEVLIWVCSLEGGPPKGVSPRVFPNLRRTHSYGNLPLHKQLCFDFLTSFPVCRKEIFPWEHENIYNWGAP